MFISSGNDKLTIRRALALVVVYAAFLGLAFLA